MQLAQTPSTLNAASEQSSREILMLEVGGMKCAGCVKAVERQLTQQSGVISATVNLVTEIAIVEYHLGELNPGVLAEQLAKQLTLAGFPAQPRQSKLGSPDTENSWTERHRQEMGQQIWRIVTCGILILLSGMGHLHHLSWGHLPLVNTIGFHWGLATLAFLVPGRAIVVDGFRSWRRNAPNMNTLVSLGTLTAYGTSCVALLLPQLGWECFFDEPVMMLGFILLGKTLEQQARFRAARALRSLLALQPATAHLVTRPIPSPPDNGASLLSIQSLQSIEIPADQVRVGEWLQVLPGEKIPVDGDVRQGKTTVDESMLTGEALPVLKQGGDFVSAGTLNHSGVILMEATRTGEETTLAQIIQLVETAQTRKAPIQTLADAVAGYFTYGVISLAAFTFLFWYCVGVHLWPQVLTLANVEVTTFAPLMLSLKLAIAVLVIACPCAMGLATPTAILVGSGIGAEQGLLIKGGDILERVHRLNIVVFDKTGTLTTGQPQITDCITNAALTPNLTPDSLLQLAATVEQGACHPIAQALCAAANQRGLLKQAAEDFYTEPGLGVSATVEGQTVLVGNAAWLHHHHVDLESDLPDLPGKTLVHLAIADQWVGTLGMQDALRPDAKSTIEQLQKMGLRVMLLTGDRHEVAESIAQALNLDPADVLADVRPEDKVKTITNLQAQGQQVAMVGDGINDAPALTQADVGIGLHTGTEVSMEAADIVLMQDDLMAVVRSIRLSQATFNKIRQNLCWAFGYNLLSIPVAAGMLLPSLGIVLSPASAGALMAFSSVSVVTNSLLLRRQFQD